MKFFAILLLCVFSAALVAGRDNHDPRCGTRGGECVASAMCGNAPQDLEGAKGVCASGEVCCIWLKDALPSPPGGIIEEDYQVIG